MGGTHPHDRLNLTGERRHRSPIAPPNSMAFAFTRLCDLITRLACLVLGVLITAIVVIAMAAVWWRYIVNDPMSWSEQVSRILFVWMTFLGAAVLYRQRLHIAIDMIVLALPLPIQRVLYWTAEIGVLIFVVVFFIFGLKLSLDTWDNTFGALDITPASFYLAAPASSALMILFFIEKMLDPTLRQPSPSAQFD